MEEEKKWDAGEPSGCFDCNICLDSIRDPVVTLCGHLFCWPCIYKWLHHDPNPSMVSQPCPVCKSPLTSAAIVPLYGRGGFEGKTHFTDIDVPKRPAPANTSASQAQTYVSNIANEDVHGYDIINPSDQQYYQYHQYYHYPRYEHYDQYVYSTGGATQLGFPEMGRGFSPPAGIGYALVPWLFGLAFGRHQSIVYYFNPDDTRGRIRENSVYQRRWPQERQAEISLGRLSIFLLCCVLLGLLMF